jgi:hypothetical protein
MAYVTRWIRAFAAGEKTQSARFSAPAQTTISTASGSKTPNAIRSDRADARDEETASQTTHHHCDRKNSIAQGCDALSGPSDVAQE